MTPRPNLSRQLSWLLRHGASEQLLMMDQAGWASVADVLRLTGITDTALGRAVKENDKGRLQLDGDRIRACQGHSPANTPVTREALEASWTVVHPARLLWHGTRLSALPGITRLGLQAGDRTHVHLAETIDSRVGKRASVEVLLAVDPRALALSGLEVFRAPNGVILIREVPPGCLVGAHPGAPSLATVVAAACRDAGLPDQDPLG